MNKKAKNTNTCGPNRVHRPWRISLSGRDRPFLPNPESLGAFIGNFSSEPRDSIGREGALVHAGRDLHRVVLPAAK